MNNSTPTLSAQVLDQLAGFDTATICNAIELFEIRPASDGFTDGRIRCCFPELPAIVGYAATATYRASEAPPTATSSRTVGDLIESFGNLPGRAVVVFQDLDDPPAAAGFGEVSCTAYQAFGAQGLITSGAGRDLDQVRELNFPVFSSSTICAHGYSWLPSIGEAAEVGGITIAPGDLIHADANGITTIPFSLAGQIADVATKLADSERVLLDYLENTESPTVRGFRDANAEMSSIVADIRSQIGPVTS